MAIFYNLQKIYDSIYQWFYDEDTEVDEDIEVDEEFKNPITLTHSDCEKIQTIFSVNESFFKDSAADAVRRIHVSEKLTQELDSSEVAEMDEETGERKYKLHFNINDEFYNNYEENNVDFEANEDIGFDDYYLYNDPENVLQDSSYRCHGYKSHLFNITTFNKVLSLFPNLKEFIIYSDLEYHYHTETTIYFAFYKIYKLTGKKYNLKFDVITWR
jgi:hypothetical protein